MERTRLLRPRSAARSRSSQQRPDVPERNEDGSYHIFSDIEAAKIYMVEGSFSPP